MSALPIFMRGDLGAGLVPSPNMPLFGRGIQLPPEQQATFDAILRGEIGSDVNLVLQQLARTAMELNRAISTGTANLPIRENLEAEASSLVPRMTPLRNKLPRTPGSGVASQWRQITSYGGGYGGTTTLTSAAGNNATAVLVFTSAAGFRVGDFLAVGTGGTLEIVQITIIAGTTVTVTPALAQDQRTSAVVKLQTRPGGGVATRAFFSESGAPAEFTTAYAAKLAGYKLMGAFGSVTGFAMAAGATFQNQLATEKGNSIINLMLNEENALINGDATSVNAPWGDGTTALAFNGLVNLITTANGTPADQVQSAVGPLTTAHIDTQLTRLYYQGAQNMYMIMAGQEIKSLAKIAQGGSANAYRILLDPNAAHLGVAVTGYLHPISGQLVEIIPSIDLSPGTILFCSENLPDGKPAADVQVLPQVQLPELAPNDSVQGYTAQELAPSIAAPQVYPFITTVYEVLRMKGATVFAKSTGVTPA